MGDATEASTALNRAESWLAKINPGVRDAPRLSYVTPGRLAADATEIFRDLRKPKTALGWSRQAGDLSDAHQTRAVGLRMAVAATAACQMRDLDQALDHGDRALALLQLVASTRARTYLEDLAAALEPWATEPQANAFLQRLQERELTTEAGGGALNAPPHTEPSGQRADAARGPPPAPDGQDGPRATWPIDSTSTRRNTALRGIKPSSHLAKEPAPMTHATSLPSDLHQWVTRHVAGMDTAAVTDASWPRGDSRVWRVRADHGEAFIKLYPSLEKYEREVKGCEHAARALADTEAPHLLAGDPERSAVVLSALPGRVVRGLPLEQTEEQHVHRLAGDLLRRWHDTPEPIDDREHQRIMASVTAQADEAAVTLERLGDQLSPAEQDLVRDAAHDLPDLARPTSAGLPSRRLLPPQLALGRGSGASQPDRLRGVRAGYRGRGPRLAVRRRVAHPTRPACRLSHRIRPAAVVDRAARARPAHCPPGRFLPQHRPDQDRHRPHRPRPHRSSALGTRPR